MSPFRSTSGPPRFNTAAEMRAFLLNTPAEDVARMIATREQLSRFIMDAYSLNEGTPTQQAEVQTALNQLSQVWEPQELDASPPQPVVHNDFADDNESRITMQRTLSQTFMRLVLFVMFVLVAGQAFEMTLTGSPRDALMSRSLFNALFGAMVVLVIIRMFSLKLRSDLRSPRQIISFVFVMVMAGLLASMLLDMGIVNIDGLRAALESR